MHPQVVRGGPASHDQGHPRKARPSRRGTIKPKKGVLTIKLKRKLRAGKYKVAITVRDAAGKQAHAADEAEGALAG